MNKQIGMVERRVRGYRYVDGTYELKLGMIAFIWAIFSFLQVKLNVSGSENLLILFFQSLLVLGGSLLVDQLIRAIKEGVTFRRSGYISISKEKSQSISPDMVILIVFLMIITGGTLFDWLNNIVPAKWLPVYPGLVLAIATAITAFRTSQARFYILAAVCLLAGIAVAVIDNGRWDVWAGSGLCFSLISIILIAMGAFTLWTYLRRNPAMLEPPDEH